MKNLIYPVLFSFIVLSVFAFSACQKEADGNDLDVTTLASICSGTNALATINAKATTKGSTSTLAYDFSLLKRKSNDDGTYTWIWSITNPTPGDGSNGTKDDVKYWGISLGTDATIKDVASAAYSYDGINWTSFTPDYKTDNAQKCYSSPVLKFDAGTKGSAKTYYRITVKKNFTAEKVDAVYRTKSANDCGTLKICGFGSAPEEDNTAKCDDRPVLSSDANGWHNVNSGSFEYYRGSTVLGGLNVNQTFDFCGSLQVNQQVNVNSNGIFVVNGSLAVNQSLAVNSKFNFNGATSVGGDLFLNSNALVEMLTSTSTLRAYKNLYINSGTKLIVRGSVIVDGNLIFNGGTIEFVGSNANFEVKGSVTKNNGAVIIGTHTGTVL